MNLKYWWPLSIFFMVIISILLEFVTGGRFDPESLPPPAAGTTTVTARTPDPCEGVIYSISQDGIKYVRESGGGILLAAELDNKIGFYQLGKYGDVRHVEHAEMDSDTSNKLEHALYNCNARYNPSGLYFAYR